MTSYVDTPEQQAWRRAQLASEIKDWEARHKGQRHAKAEGERSNKGRRPRRKKP